MPKSSRYIAHYLRGRTVLLQDRGSSLSAPILLRLALHRWRNSGSLAIIRRNPSRLIFGAPGKLAGGSLNGRT
jgi:hypothetical protein